MKNFYTLLLALFSSIGLFAQGSYNFDSYTVGSYMGNLSPDWTTWSGSTGGAEDVKIDTINSYSGANSIYFSSTSASGGPQDVLLNFGGTVLQNGDFSFESMFYIEGDNAGYFNFQGEITPGNSFATSCYLDDDGGLILSPDGPSVISQSYPVDQWFNLKITADLTLNVWELFIDGVSQGTWQNTVNQVAAVDLYPVNPNNMGTNTNSSYWMDDVIWDFVPYVLLNLNGGVTAVNVNTGIVNQQRPLSVEIMNLGSTAITSFDVVVDYAGTQYTENITGVSLNSFETYIVNYSQELTLVVGNNQVVATISNVNGTTDDDATDDSKSISIDPVVAAPGKLVIGEEATGTWCGWCPRGAVGLDEMERDYEGFFQGIAVHNGDPMTHTDYDAGIGTYISGYPSAIVDRGGDIDPSAFETPLLQRITIAPAALISPSAVYTAVDNSLTVTLDLDFEQAISGDWRVACIITEDEVTGVDVGYNQSNYYSSQSNGISLVAVDGTDWMDLSNPVPASQMIYRHVARDIQPSFYGLANSFPSSVAIGESYSFDFTFSLDPSWDVNKMKAIGILIDDSGEIDNGGAMNLFHVTSIGEQAEIMSSNPKLYPNPANDNTILKLDLLEMKKVALTITNINGQTVFVENYGAVKGEYLFPLNTSEFPAGIYLVEIQTGSSVEIIKLIMN